MRFRQQRYDTAIPNRQSSLVFPQSRNSSIRYWKCWPPMWGKTSRLRNRCGKSKVSYRNCGRQSARDKRNKAVMEQSPRRLAQESLCMDWHSLYARILCPVYRQLGTMARVPGRKQTAENGCRQTPCDHGHAQRVVPWTVRDRRGIRKTGGNGWLRFYFEHIQWTGQSR